jgi:hypothetical protein
VQKSVAVSGKNPPWEGVAEGVMCRSAIVLLAATTALAFSQALASDLRETFASPPPDTRPGCYWYWINDNISKEGITKDLEAMARVGIGRAYIGHIYNRKGATDTPVGDVKFMSEDWWDALQWAVKEAGRVGVEIGFFNSPGWSQSGGPWITPAQSMRFLDASETVVEGGRKIDQVLPIPEIKTHPSSGGSKPEPTGPNFTARDFQDVGIIAFRQPDAETGEIPASAAEFPLKIGKTPRQFDFSTDGTRDLQSLRLVVIDTLYTITCVVSTSEDGTTFHELARHVEERGHQGARVKDPMLIPFPPTRAKHIRVTLSATKPVNLASLALSRRAVVAYHVRKQLGETSPSVAPPWDAYQWNPQPPPAEGGTVDSRSVIDLTGKTDATGRLVWDAPPGRWVVQRMGMVPMGTQCAPASPEARGLEADKMSKQHIRGLFDGMVGEFIRRTPAEERTALKFVIADSYETGPQNWTDDMEKKFETLFGYSPLPFLPCLHGRVVDSPEITVRFLWDWRRLIAESIARDYVGGLREVAQENGLILWLENYGHWGFPSEFLLYGSMSDQIGGEFWESGGPEGNVELRAASSAANTYGRADVYAEAYTSSRTFQQSPASMKAWTDWAFSAGINHFILHVYIHQPDERKPGILQWFGTDFNRHTTWFEPGKAFIDFLRRSSVLLKHGRPRADVAYFIGENTPVMTGPQDPSLPAGYDFDFINSDALLHRSRVVDGRIVMENGPSYAVLVLPRETLMRPEMAGRLHQLIRDGATVIGPKPTASPSLENYPLCDEQTRLLADEVWGPVDGKAVKQRSFGKGVVYDGVSLEEVFSKLGIEPDVRVEDHPSLQCAVAHAKSIGIGKKGGIVFKHRGSPEREIYFLSNTSDQAVSFTASLRISGRQPWLWNTVAGTITKAEAFTQHEGRTRIPLQLAASESIHVVFEEPISSDVQGGKETNSPSPGSLLALDGPWTVRFHGQGAPAETIFSNLTDWTKHPDGAIRHYAGPADYEMKFNLDESIVKDGRLVLDLGEAAIMASVTVNGREVGTLWCPPWKIDIGAFVRAGENSLRIRVVNTWHNRLVADAGKPENERLSHISQPYRVKPESPPATSGLLGPVRVLGDAAAVHPRRER